MKRWLIALAVASATGAIGLAYFVIFASKDGCLDSGGRWLGLVHGCEGGDGYSLHYLSSPLSIAIFLGIILGISSALVQIHSLLFKPQKR